MCMTNFQGVNHIEHLVIDLIIVYNTSFTMISDYKMCVTDYLWEYKVFYGTYH